MKKLFAIILALSMVLSMGACAKQEAAHQPAEPVQTEAATEAAQPAAPAAPVNVMVLNGTTGFGMANLMDAASRGEAAQEYAAAELDEANGADRLFGFVDFHS